jgi:hypothetical protein
LSRFNFAWSRVGADDGTVYRMPTELQRAVNPTFHPALSGYLDAARQMAGRDGVLSPPRI